MNNNTSLKTITKSGSKFSDFCFVVLLLLGFVGFAQQSTVKGSVTSSDDKTPIPNVSIIVKTDGGQMFFVKTDSLGNYSLLLDWKKYRQVELYPQPDKNNKTPTVPCGFFASDQKKQIKYNDSLVNYIAYFQLTPMICCGLSLPIILFQKNSIALTDSVKIGFDGEKGKAIYSKTIDELMIMYKVLMDNPSMLIELSAHCSSDEKNVEILSQKRAEYIKGLLIEKGIPSERLVAKNYGTTKLKITDKQIYKAKTKEEKEALHEINRRVVFKILSWDYKPQGK